MKLKILILLLAMMAISCSHKCEIGDIDNRKTASKRIEYEIQSFDEVTKNNYFYIKKFIDGLITSGNNYLNYLENNQFVDCNEVIAVLKSERKSNLNLRKKYRETFDQYFQDINIYNTYIYNIEIVNPSYGEGDFQIKIASEKIDDIIIFGFNRPSLKMKNNKSDYRLVVLYSCCNSFGRDNKIFDTDSLQEQSEYLKKFMKELIKNRKDYWNYLQNNNYVKLNNDVIERFTINKRYKDALYNFFMFEDINEIEVGENFRLCGTDILCILIPVYGDQLYIGIRFFKNNNVTNNKFTYIIEFLSLQSLSAK